MEPAGAPGPAGEPGHPSLLRKGGGGERGRERYRYTDRQTERETDRQTDREIRLRGRATLIWLKVQFQMKKGRIDVLKTSLTPLPGVHVLEGELHVPLTVLPGLPPSVEGLEDLRGHLGHLLPPP